MSHRLNALLLTILIHIILYLSFFIIVERQEEVKEKISTQKRIKVSLKEPSRATNPLPKVAKEISTIKSTLKTQKPHKKIDSEYTPILKPKLIKKPLIHVEKKRVLKPKKALPKVIKRPKNSRPVSRLASLLSTPTKEEMKERRSIKSGVGKSIKELYGETYEKLSLIEKNYMEDNMELMRRITQRVLNRVARANIPQNLHFRGENMVEFFLYPDGSISAIRVLKKASFYILNQTSTETIEYAHKDYPRPSKPIRIRYLVRFQLSGF